MVRPPNTKRRLHHGYHHRILQSDERRLRGQDHHASAQPTIDVTFERVINRTNEKAPKGHGTKFGRKKEAAIAALLTHRNIEEAAKAVGISSPTLIAWMKVPEFDQANREARRDAFRQSVARLQQASGAAVTTLLKIMMDGSAPASTRLRAADIVLAHT
jgi:hypothetical protein